MICYIDRAELGDVEALEPAVLLYLIQKAEQANGRYTRLERYYRGDYPLLYPRPEADEVRVYINYAKYVVDIALGYYLGQPVKYDHNPTRRGAALPGCRRKGFLWGRAPLIWHRCYGVMTANTSARRIWRSAGAWG